MAEKLKSLEILEQPYLRNRLTDFYGTKTKLYREASSFIICGKESQRNNFEFSLICLLLYARSRMPAPSEWIAHEHEAND